MPRGRHVDETQVSNVNVEIMLYERVEQQRLHLAEDNILLYRYLCLRKAAAIRRLNEQRIQGRSHFARIFFNSFSKDKQNSFAHARCRNVIRLRDIFQVLIYVVRQDCWVG